MTNEDANNFGKSFAKAKSKEVSQLFNLKS